MSIQVTFTTKLFIGKNSHMESVKPSGFLNSLFAVPSNVLINRKSQDNLRSWIIDNLNYQEGVIADSVNGDEELYVRVFISTGTFQLYSGCNGDSCWIEIFSSILPNILTDRDKAKQSKLLKELDYILNNNSGINLVKWSGIEK